MMGRSTLASSNLGSDRQDLYRYSAAWFDVRYAQKDYAAESARLARLIDRVHPRAATLLDVACGTGRHLEHLRERYRVEGLDRSPDLLRIARTRLGGTPLHRADMDDFDLGRSFDVVTCLFASLPYLGSPDRMRRAVAGMARHLAPGGLLVVEPGLTPAVYREGEVVHNVRQTPAGTVSWMYVMRRRGSLAVWDVHWLIGTSDQGIRHSVEREEFALFTTEELTGAMNDAGLDVARHGRGLHGYGMLIGRACPWRAGERTDVAAALDG